MSERRQHIINTVTDLVSKFMYYDRKEDEDLPRGAIEEAMQNGEITHEEIVEIFSNELEKETP